MEKGDAGNKLGSWLQLRSALAVQVESTGWTLTPLSPSYTHGHESSETLVTMVAKV